MSSLLAFSSGMGWWLYSFMTYSGLTTQLFKTAPTKMSCGSGFTLSITITYSYRWTISLLSTHISPTAELLHSFLFFLLQLAPSFQWHHSWAQVWNAMLQLVLIFTRVITEKKVDTDIYQNIAEHKHHPLSWTWKFMPASLVFLLRVWLIWLMPDFNKISRSLLDL